jgi:hypothetical protein
MGRTFSKEGGSRESEGKVKRKWCVDVISVGGFWEVGCKVGDWNVVDKDGDT